jgi:HPt (histidine-containing phosphotransfer) domain-containing protein
MPDSHEAQIRDGLARLWKRSKPNVVKRVKAVSSTIDAMRDGVASPDAIHEAREQAHKLAGSLGTFGLPDASKLAKAIEIELERELPKLEELLSLSAALSEVAQLYDPPH